MINRPILVVTIGYLIGIIIGLYCKISIALFILPIVFGLYLAKNKIRHYTKIFEVRKIIILIAISALVSNTIVLILNRSYDIKYQNIEEANFVATIVSEPKIKQYSIQYKVRVESIDGKENYKNTYLYLKVKKDNNLKFGDKVKFIGSFIEPDTARNYGGFNYKQYLKSIGIYGTVKATNINVIGKGKISSIKTLANNVANHIKEVVDKNIQNEDNKNLLLGILLGNDEELENSIKEDFQNSSLSHILAVSGMHVSYVILGISILLSKCKLPKKITKISTIILLIFFIFLTGESPSVKRSCIMAIFQVRSRFGI